jgi:hypothetical protein
MQPTLVSLGHQVFEQGYVMDLAYFQTCNGLGENHCTGISSYPSKEKNQASKSCPARATLQLRSYKYRS